jgi:hypothetical protein
VPSPIPPDLPQEVESEIMEVHYPLPWTEHENGADIKVKEDMLKSHEAVDQVDESHVRDGNDGENKVEYEHDRLVDISNLEIPDQKVVPLFQGPCLFDDF